MSTKTYFLAKNLEIPPPPNGPLRLGSIIVDNKDLRALNKKKFVEIPKDEIFTDIKPKFKYKNDKENKGTVGIWAKLTEVMDLGEASFSYNRGLGFSFTCRELETTYFLPDTQYIEDSVKSAPVEAWMNAKEYKKPVYMITGLKIVRDASFSTHKTRGHEEKLRVGGNLAPVAGVPIEVGPKIEESSTKSESLSFKGAKEFVIGYQLRKIWYKSGKITDKELVKGAVLDGDDTDLEPKEIVYSQKEISAKDLVDEDDDNVQKSPEVVSAEDENGELCEWVLSG